MKNRALVPLFKESFMNVEKQVDESWKDSTQQEKEILIGDHDAKKDSGLHIPESIKQQDDDNQETKTDAVATEAVSHTEVNFVNYISSLAFQTMIFLGDIPNPVTNEIDKNLDQAKFLIDTLSLLKEKTQGNLNEQEENLLSASVYELQMKYVEASKN